MTKPPLHCCRGGSVEMNQCSLVSEHLIDILKQKLLLIQCLLGGTAHRSCDCHKTVHKPQRQTSPLCHLALCLEIVSKSSEVNPPVLIKILSDVFHKFTSYGIKWLILTIAGATVHQQNIL